MHFGHISSEALETTKIPDLVLRSRVRQDTVNVKQHNSMCRLGAHCWDELVHELSQDVEEVTRLEPDDPKAIVSETLGETLNVATSTLFSMRSTESLQTFLQHCDELIERKFIGLCKVVSDQSVLLKSSVDGILLDLLKYFVRTGTTEKRLKLVNVMIPKLDAAMTRYWLRFKKQASNLCLTSSRTSHFGPRRSVRLKCFHICPHFSSVCLVQRSVSLCLRAMKDK